MGKTIANFFPCKKVQELDKVIRDSLAEKRYPKKPDFRALEEEGKKEYLKKQKENQ